MRIVGYTSRLSASPGDRIRLMVSTQEPSFHASLHRLAGTGGPGHLESGIEGTYPGVEQLLRLGSHILVPGLPRLGPGEGFTLEAWVWPTAPGSRTQVVVGCHDGERGYALGVDRLGSSALWLDKALVATGHALQPRAWYFLRASYDPESGYGRIEQTPRNEWPGSLGRQDAEQEVSGWSASTAPFRIAAWGEPADAHYNGKIEAPRLLRADGSVLGAWNLGGDFASDEVIDISGGGRHGRCVNLPMRAVSGHSWRGAVTNPALAPEEYGAIWFHDDDLEDACWEPAFELLLPAELDSGVFAIRVSAGDDVDDEIPFFVRPLRGRPTSDVVVLIPTFSYLAYGNEHNSWANPIPSTAELEEILEQVGASDRFAARNRLKSIYELHSDGSGVAYASRLRPIVNMRSDYRMPLLRGGPHQFSADMQLLRWLDNRQIRYDLVTDEDLHHEGRRLLEGYRVLVTGSHPEYWSGAMLDGLDSWLDGGGRLMYLGGNGFYWVTSTFPALPHVLEVRRGHAGTGVWRSEPGEIHHASTGEPGGLWRFRGRPPQKLVGVGFTAQGFDTALPYRLTSHADDDRAAWIFAGVASEPLGAHGAVLGGAAGFEIDRADQDLGTPPHALVIATARGFSDGYQGASEDILTADSKQGGSVNPLVRSDIVYFERANGGAVFSTGSIAWCGALLDNEGENDVSRVTQNVLRRFAE